MSEVVPQLIGTYEIPSCNPGDTVLCGRRGPVRVCGSIANRIGWPRGQNAKGSACLICTPDLVRALAIERSSVFAYWFGVSEARFSSLRTHFGIKREPPKDRKLGKQVSIHEDLRHGPYEVPVLDVWDKTNCLRCGDVQVGGFCGPLKWPGSTRGTRAFSLVVTDELLRLVRLETSNAAACALGCSTAQIQSIRWHFGIVSRQKRRPGTVTGPRPVELKPEEIALLGTMSDTDVAKIIGSTPGKIINRRRELGIPAYRKPSNYRRFWPPARGVRHSGWPALRASFIAGKTCAACGGSKHLEVHHTKPVCEFPELELDDGNLIVLCEDEDFRCHWRIGHSFKWHSWNPHVVEDAALQLKRIRERLLMPHPTSNPEPFFAIRLSVPNESILARTGPSAKNFSPIL